MRRKVRIDRIRHASLAMAIFASSWPSCRDRPDQPSGGASEAASGDSPTDAVRVGEAESRLADADQGYEAWAASTAPCSSPGYGPGPELRSDAGQASFVVIFNCLWPSHHRMEMSVALSRQAKRAEVEVLLRSLWKDLQSKMGRDFPETVKLCVFAPGSNISETPLGCMRKGYEPEGDPDEEEADLRIDMRPEPADLAAGLGKAFGKRFGGAHRPRITFDQVRGELTMEYPYVDEGTDRWATKPSYVDVTLPFFALAWEFYPPRTDLSALTFKGVWNGKTLLRAHLRDLETFLAMKPWAIRQRLEEAHIPYALGAMRTDEQSAVIRNEFEAALAKLPAGSATLEPSLP
jgi:hypothetical protein